MILSTIATFLLVSETDGLANIHRVKREILSAGQMGMMEIVATYNPSFSRQKFMNGYGCHCQKMLDANHLGMRKKIDH